MNLLLSNKKNQGFRHNRALNRFRDFISKSRKKLSPKDDKNNGAPQNPFGPNPPFGGLPALAF